MKPPRTLQEAIVYFSDPQRAFDYAVSLRWPDGKVHCPRCSSDKNYFIKTRRIWLCRGCNKQFTLKVNTIFEDSPLGLDKWMTASGCWSTARTASPAWRFTALWALRRSRHGLCFNGFALLCTTVRLDLREDGRTRTRNLKPTKRSSVDSPRTCTRIASCAL